MIGTDQPVGSIDPYSEGSTDGGVTWGPTYSIGGHPWQNRGGQIPGTETDYREANGEYGRWVNVYPSPFIGLYTTNWIRIRFNMPETYSNVNMNLMMKADNYGSIYMNGVALAEITGWSLTSGDYSSETVTSILQPGQNEILLRLVDVGGWVAFQYRIDITFESDDTAIVGKAGDTDVDGLTDEEELALGTDPNNPDSDGDGILDGVEVNNGTNPVDPTSGPPVVDTDGDGVGDNADLIDNSDTSATVIIKGIDSGVTNTVNADGITLADMIHYATGTCGKGSKNHGQYVSCVAKYLNVLLKSGIITDEEKDALQSAAAQTDIGKTNSKPVKKKK